MKSIKTRIETRLCHRKRPNQHCRRMKSIKTRIETTLENYISYIEQLSEDEIH